MKKMTLLMALAALSASGLAAAGSRQANSVVVRYGDLNLESRAGLATLHQRIRHAAESVCRPLETRILGLRDAFNQCVDQAVSDGIAAIDNPKLTEFHANRGKRSVLASN